MTPDLIMLATALAAAIGPGALIAVMMWRDRRRWRAAAKAEERT